MFCWWESGEGAPHRRSYANRNFEVTHECTRFALVAFGPGPAGAGVQFVAMGDGSYSER